MLDMEYVTLNLDIIVCIQKILHTKHGIAQCIATVAWTVHPASIQEVDLHDDGWYKLT